jgi:hypothetical protein
MLETLAAVFEWMTVGALAMLALRLLVSIFELRTAWRRWKWSVMHRLRDG